MQDQQVWMQPGPRPFNNCVRSGECLDLSDPWPCGKRPIITVFSFWVHRTKLGSAHRKCMTECCHQGTDVYRSWAPDLSHTILPDMPVKGEPINAIQPYYYPW